MNHVLVSGSFDDLCSRQVRFLEEASRFGPVQALLWSDMLALKLDGKRPKFPQAERQYFLESIRFVNQVILIDNPASADCLPATLPQQSSIWVLDENAVKNTQPVFCQSIGNSYCVIPEERLKALPQQFPGMLPPDHQKRRVIVTGCYDWLHTGHVRFFEEASQLGDLYVVIGSDDNVRLLKGDKHPLFHERERLYMVQSIRHVTQALVSSGSGWLDAEPEIRQIHPDFYVVNEDGDRPEKRRFCEENGLEYVVLKRLPKEGLPRRESTHLRGF